MAKYIDLLRAYRKDKSPPATVEERPLGVPEQQYGELESMLQDEPESEARAAAFDEEILAEELPDETPEQLSAAEAEKIGSGELVEISDWLNRCIELTRGIFRAARANTKVSIVALSTHISELIAEIKEHDGRIDALELEVSLKTKQILDVDDDLGSLIQKSVMMMLYSIKMGAQLKLHDEALRSFTLAAMLHHIGMAQVPASIRNKKERLSPEELEEIRKAPRRSHDYLEACGITDTTILLAASQSPERFDGSGPQGLASTDIAFSARMIGLLSMFEALIHYRPYRARLLPRDAIRELVNHHKKAFDPAILKALIESISLYPVGTYVQLNTGDIGLVTQVNQRLPLRPRVLLSLDRRGNEIPGRLINLQEQPNLMVKHCMYEEQLADLKEEAPGH